MSQKHLTKSRHGIYYFQYWIPKRLKNNEYDKSIFRLSLNTSNRREAVKQSHRLIVLMYDIEDKYNNNPNKFGSALIAVQQKYKNMPTDINQLIENEEECFRRGKQVALDLLKFEQDESRLLYTPSQYDLKCREDVLIRDAYILMKKYLEEVKWGREYALDTYFSECFDFAVGNDKEFAKQYSNINFTSTNTHLKSQPTINKKPVLNEILSECIKPYINEKRKGWNTSKGKKTENEYIAKIKLLIEIVGDKSASLLTYDDMINYKNTLLDLPTNKNKMPQYREKTISQLLEMDIPDEDKFGENTLKNHFTKISSFLGWLKRNKKTVDDDLQDAIRGVIKGKKSASSDREIFTDDELKRLYESEEYIRHNHKEPNKYWIPLIGLFTGARENDICQLYKEDIIEKDGVWCFDFNDNAHDKHLKEDDNHARIIPIHQQLIDLGFIEYVDGVKAVRIFPELKYYPDEGHYATSFSKWFNRTYKKNCDVGQKPEHKYKKVFHSLRHNLIDLMINEHDVPQSKAAKIVGQMPVDGSVTTTRYAKKLKIKDSNKIIQRIKWNIDFSKTRKW